MRTGSRVLVTEGGGSRPSWTLLAVEVWEGSWNNSCVEKEFKLGVRKCEEYMGLRFRDGESVTVSWWLTNDYVEWMRMSRV